MQIALDCISGYGYSACVIIGHQTTLRLEQYLQPSILRGLSEKDYVTVLYLRFHHPVTPVLALARLTVQNAINIHGCSGQVTITAGKGLGKMRGILKLLPIRSCPTVTVLVNGEAEGKPYLLLKLRTSTNAFYLLVKIEESSNNFYLRLLCLLHLPSRTLPISLQGCAKPAETSQGHAWSVQIVAQEKSK